jgi:hypothetical protein
MMSNQDYRQPSSQNSSSSGTGSSGGNVSSSSSSSDRGYGSDMLAKASELAGEAAGKVKEGASDTAASIRGGVKHLLDDQVHTGAHMVEKLAASAKRAAQDLDRDSPQLAGMVRALADRLDGYAENLEGVTADELLKNATDFTRRQPALTFGLAALAGFFVMRTLKSAQTSASISSPSIQPSHPERRQTAGSFHGA